MRPGEFTQLSLAVQQEVKNVSLEFKRDVVGRVTASKYYKFIKVYKV
jgi:hypothetical protein